MIVPKKVHQANLPEGECAWITEGSTSCNLKLPTADGEKGCISLIPLPKIDELYAKLKVYSKFSQVLISDQDTTTSD